MLGSLRRIPKWGLMIGAFVGAVILVQAIPGPNDEDDVVLNRISCVATSVALHQYLYDYEQAGNPSPAWRADFDTRANRLQSVTRRLQTSADPHVPKIRPIIARAEAARDDAVATDAEGYITSAWQEVQTCHDQIFPEAA